MTNWITSFPEEISVNIRDPVDRAVKYMTVNWDPFFSGISDTLRSLLGGIGFVVNRIPWWVLLIAVFVLTIKITRRKSQAFLYTGLMFFIGMMGLWPLMNQTLTITIASVIISLIIGLPLGVLISFSERSDAIVRPILDTMQTMPAFVYLIPAAMFLGLGNPPAVIATTIYAVPPVVRLTSHGIRQVDREVVEAAKAFGSTKMQTLFKVQIPQALPTIMAGINQTLMMAISMVVTCAMIGASGLGLEVLTGINQLKSGRGLAAGIAIVIIAIVMDRLTQGIFKKKDGDSQ